MIKNWLASKNISEIHSFLRLASYYRKFVLKFSAIVLPLTDLLHKDKKFIWNDSVEQSFQKLKEQLVFAPVLILPDPTKDFTVTTDALNFTVSAVLMQNYEKDKQSVTYESRKLIPAEQKYPMYKKELLTIIHTLKIWQLYFKGQKFLISTDHTSLTYLKSQFNLS